MEIIETNWNWAKGLSVRPATRYIALHHAAAKNCSAKDVDRWHKSNGWSGIGYHFFVEKDGSIYRGRPLKMQGSHVLHRNNESIGICAEGDYDKEQTMPAAQKAAIKELLGYLKGIYPSATIVGHREIGESDCPGKYYPLAELKMYKEEIDMEELNQLKAQTAAISAKVDSAVEKLSKEIRELQEKTTPMIYDYIDDNMPEWAKEGVRFCLEKGIIKGTGEGKLGLTDTDLKFCTMTKRMFDMANPT